MKIDPLSPRLNNFDSSQIYSIEVVESRPISLHNRKNLILSNKLQ